MSSAISQTAPRSNPPRIVIAGAHSGVGKTTVTLGIQRALARQGRRVQGFKVGPDYIDPSHHTRVTGRPARNLDTWMCPENVVLELFERTAALAEVSVIEGVMGLFDGYGALDERGSAAHLAKLLGAPVVLVIDAQALARSAGALVLGYQTFDPDVRLAGVIANNVAGERHFEFVAPAIEQRTGVPVLGWLPRDREITIEERHLGLVTGEEWQKTQAWYDRIADLVEAHVDLARLLELARSAPPLPSFDCVLFTPSPPPPAVRVGVALDEAFCFYYEDNLDLLRHRGAEIVAFSPVHDAHLPDVDLLYFGGGFPELFCAQLSQNATMLDDVRAFIAADKPVYAECGGLMYLGGGITTFEGERFAMVDVLPVETSMTRRRLSLGYVAVTAQRDTVLSPKGETFRGHEFHYSTLTLTGPIEHAFARTRGNGNAAMPPDGFVVHNVLAGYTHAHFGSNPQLAENLILAARRSCGQT